MTLKPLLPLCFGASLLLTSIGTSATLVRYEFTSGSATSPTAPSPLISASNVTATSQFQVSATSGSAFLRHNSSSSNAPAGNAATSLEEAITRGNTYIQFSVTPTVSGLSLTSFQFNHSTSLIANSTDPIVLPPDFTSNLSIFASLDGFSATPVATDALFTSTGTTNGASASFGNPTFNFTSLNNLSPSDIVTFRVYAYGSGEQYNQVSRIDNIIISGVPEPTPAALLGLAGVTFALRRRKN